MLLLLSLLLHCLVVDVAALQFVGPSTLVLSLTSNNFWLTFIFLLFWIFCLQQFLCIYSPPVTIPTVTVEVWRTLLLGIPYFYTWNATLVARYIYCYKYIFFCTNSPHPHNPRVLVILQADLKKDQLSSLHLAQRWLLGTVCLTVPPCTPLGRITWFCDHVLSGVWCA